MLLPIFYPCGCECASLQLAFSDTYPQGYQIESSSCSVQPLHPKRHEWDCLDVDTQNSCASRVGKCGPLQVSTFKYASVNKILACCYPSYTQHNTIWLYMCSGISAFDGPRCPWKEDEQVSGKCSWSSGCDDWNKSRGTKITRRDHFWPPMFLHVLTLLLFFLQHLREKLKEGNLDPREYKVAEAGLVRKAEFHV